MTDPSRPAGAAPTPQPDAATLSRLVAEHVLGWAYRPRFDGDTTGYYGDVITEELPDFGADMGAAWEVVLALAAHDWRVDLRQTPTGLWRCAFAPVGGGTTWRRIDARAPRAICLAALRAVGFQGEVRK